MRFRKFLFAVIPFAVFAILAGPKDAYADSIDDKWMFTQYYQCMLSDNVEAEIPEVPLSGNVLEWVFLPTGDMYLPSYNKMGKEKMNCREVAKKVLSKYSGITWKNNAKSEELMLSVLKYEPVKTSSNGESIFNIRAQQHKTTTTQKCNNWTLECESPSSKDEDSEISTVQIRVTPNADGTMYYQMDSLLENVASTIKIKFENHNMIVSFNPSIIAGCSGTPGEMSFPLKNNVREFYNDVVSGLENVTWGETCYSDPIVTPISTTTTDRKYSYTFTTDGDSQIVDYSDSMGYRRTIDSAANSVAAISSYGGTNGIKLTNNEYFTLYNFYLDKAIAAGGAMANKKTCNPSSTNGLTEVKLLDSATNKLKQCYVNLGTVGLDTTVYTQVGGPAIGTITLREMIEFLNGLSDSDLDTSSLTPGVDSDNDQSGYDPGSGSGSSSTDDDEDDDGVYPCLEAAESLGWVLCPVLNFLGNTINVIYDYVENNFLIVDAGMLSGETHVAWGKFRDFANVIFIIVFLIVILSQITGFGISNYGIKKVLPRLIAMVILVNISFILCQLAVDVSNIVGASIKDLLSNLSKVHLDGEISAGGIATHILSVLGLGAAGVLAPSVAAIITSSLATGTMGYWLLMILVTFIGFLIGILFAGILLAARQAGVILLVVLSPVAIACYALPNTKPIFDKWRRIFMSLLLVYPMCGAIVGGGQFATSLLINNNGGFFYTLIAMLLSIVPFFFIPTLVRTSLNSIGQLGARLSNFGKGMSGRLTGAIRGSERFKDAQRELGLRRDEATVRRLDARRASGKTLTAAQQRRRARAYARADKGRREDIVGESYRDRGLLRYDEKRREQLEGNLSAKDFDERVSGAKVAYRDDPRMATEAAIVAEHNKLLEEYGEDPNNIQLQSQLRALEEMAMEKGAPGQDLLQQSFARYVTQNKKSWNDNKGLAMSKLGAGMATRYGKELNGSDKGFNAMMNHFAEKKFKLDSFNGNEQSGYSSAYDTKLAGFTAAGMGKATPGALQRGLAALQSGGFRANNPKDDAELRAQAQTLVSNATQALNDELIANDIKPTEKGFVQGIAAYGASMPGNSAIITGLGQGSLENLSQFVDSTNDTSALTSLGQNIQDAANSSHLYGEAETSRIKMIINKINSKAGTSYTFNPASMQIDKGQQQVPDAFDDPVMREYQQAQQAASNEYIPPSTAMADEDFRRDIGK